MNGTASFILRKNINYMAKALISAFTFPKFLLSFISPFALTEVMPPMATPSATPITVWAKYALSPTRAATPKPSATIRKAERSGIPTETAQ